MCGIVGVITAYKNGFDYREADAFRDMLVIDTLRGFDSTGAFGITNIGNVAIIKDAVTGGQFVRTSEYRKLHTDLVTAGMFAVGHNRAATRGEVNAKNAHPFVAGDNKIVLVQNGTYKGDHKHHKNVEVDTEAVAHVIAEEDDVEKALQKINAAYALVWYNTKTYTLNIIRNEERPMFIGYTKDGGVLFASEKETILTAASRNGLELNKPPYLIAPNMLLTYKIDAEQKEWESDCKQNLKIAYDYKTAPHYRSSEWPKSQPYATSANDNDEVGSDFNLHMGLPRSLRELSHYRRALNDTVPYEKKNTSLINSIHTHISRGKLNDWAVTKEQAEKISKAIRAVPYSKPHVVEIVDYLPGNTMPDCRCWILYGCSVDVDDDSSAVFYHTLFDSDEEEAMQFVQDQFFFMRGYNPVETVDYADMVNPKVVVSVYCSEIEKCELNIQGAEVIEQAH